METAFYTTGNKYTEIFCYSDIHLYESGDDYKLEIWGASTKHPDTIHLYSEKGFIKSEYIPRSKQVYNFILQVAANSELPMYAAKIARFGLKYLEKYEEDILHASYLI